LQAASKQGFILSPVAGKKGDFQALKLGQIEIVVRRISYEWKNSNVP